MSKALFLHASLNVPNLLERPSLLMEKVNASQTALEYLMQGLSSAKSLDRFYLVASDQAVDDPVARAVEKAADGRWSLLRIPSASPFAVDSRNLFIDDRFTYRQPHYGFLAADFFLDYCRSQDIEFGIVALADSHVLMRGSLLDAIADQTLHRGDYFFLGEPCSFITGIPVSEAKLLTMQFRSERKARLEHVLRTIDDDETFMQKEHGTRIDAELKKRNVQKLLGRPHVLPQLIGFRNMRDGIVKKGLSELFPGKEMQFYPLLSEEHLRTVKKCIETYDAITLENFFEKEAEAADAAQADFPGYLEVELTGRCNLACKNCPQTVLKRKKEDMPEGVYRGIVNLFAGHVPMMCLSGFGEPLLHDKAADFVRYAKDKGMHRVALETNGTLLSEEKIRALIKAGLDILILNLDALDAYSGSEGSDAVIGRFLNVRGGSATPWLVVQSVNTMNKKRKLDYYFRRWQHIADCVLLLPFNDFLGTFREEGIIDFTPPREAGSSCKKTLYSALFLSDGTLTFCRQKFEGFDAGQGASPLEQWRGFRGRGLREDFCKGCRLWYQTDIAPFSELRQHQPSFLEDKLYSVLIGTATESGKAFYDRQDYDRALDEWEKVLRFDPSNTFIHGKLDELIRKLEEKKE
jgi:tetratricopeptide (TPR) repeat protein